MASAVVRVPEGAFLKSSRPSLRASGHPPEGTFPRVLNRDDPPPRPIDHVRGAVKRGAAEVVQWGWEAVVELGSIGPRSRRGRRFGRLGEGSVICFPAVA